MYADFIDSFKKTSQYKELLDKHNVVMIFICGSRLIGAIDDRSDYDLVVLTDSNDIYFSKTQWTYLDKKVHWYCLPVANYKYPKRVEENINSRTLIYCGHAYFSLLKEDLIIYENDNYKDLISEIKQKSKENAIIGAKYCYETNKNYINLLINNINDTAWHSKLIYHFCNLSFIVLNETIDVDFANEVKRIRYKAVSDACKERIVARLTLLKSYFKGK